MKTWVWLSLCFACFSWGIAFGTWMSYRQERERMLKRAEEEMKRMDAFAEDCKVQIECAYKNAQRMMGIDIRTGGTQ